MPPSSLWAGNPKLDNGCEKMTVTPERKTGIARIGAAFSYSLNGIKETLKTEAAFRQELLLFGLSLIALYWLPVPFIYKCLLFVVSCLVLIVELINSAIESVVDLACPDYSLLAKKAKDCGSAAVFVGLLLAGILWALLIIHIVWG